MADKKKLHPLEEEGGGKFVAEYLATIVHLLRSEISSATESTVRYRALLAALSDKFPDLPARVEHHLETDKAIAGHREKARQIIAELDKLHGRVKYDQ